MDPCLHYQTRLQDPRDRVPTESPPEQWPILPVIASPEALLQPLDKLGVFISLAQAALDALRRDFQRLRDERGELVTVCEVICEVRQLGIDEDISEGLAVA